MTELELLRQEVAKLMAEHTRRSTQLQQRESQLQQQLTLIEQKDSLLSEQSATIRQQEEKLGAQQLRINELLQLAFGRRSERYLENPHQLKMDFGDTPDVADAADGLQQAIDEKAKEDAAAEPEVVTVPAHSQKRKKKRNDSLPENLPRIEKTVDAFPGDKHCGTHGDKVLIGYDVTESLVYTPPKLEIHATKYPKYACPNQPECGVAQHPRPEGLIEGNRYDTSVAAEIITAKYGFHLPFYRQQDLFAGSGWTPSRSTLLNILTAAAVLIRPLVRFFADEVRGDRVIGTDDTRVTLLLPASLPEADPNDVRSERVREVLSAAFASDKKHVNAKMWAYRGCTVPLNIFDFSVSRHRDGPDQFLVDNEYEGVLLADCYSGYPGIALRSDDRIQHAACNAHARRKIFEARHNHPQAASVLLALYKELYAIETRGKLLTPEALLQLRATEAVAVWQRIREYLDGDVIRRLLPSEIFFKAVEYLNSHWIALQLYLSDPQIPIDNNDVEQLMKQVAIGRKNWLFIGSLAAGDRTADVMTLVSSALRNDLHVWSYVKGVLDALLSGSTDYASLRPDRWAATHPDDIRTYRQEERRDRVDRKQRRNETRRQAKS